MVKLIPNGVDASGLPQIHNLCFLYFLNFCGLEERHNLIYELNERMYTTKKYDQCE